MKTKNNVMAQAITAALMITPQQVQQWQGNPDAPTVEEQNTFLKDFVADPEELPKLSEASRTKLYTSVKGLSDKAAKAPAEQTLEEKTAADKKIAEAKTAEETNYAGVKAGKVLSQEAAGRIAALARSEGIPYEKAAKLLAAADSETGALMQAKNDAWNTTVKGWETSVKGDAELGGANYDATTTLANKVLKKFGSEDLSKFLKETGIGSHPEFVRVFHRIGKMFKEDDLVIPSAQQTAPEKKSAAHALYGEDGISGSK